MHHERFFFLNVRFYYLTKQKKEMNIVDYLQIQSLKDIKKERFLRMIIMKKIMLIGYAKFFDNSKKKTNTFKLLMIFIKSK